MRFLGSALCRRFGGCFDLLFCRFGSPSLNARNKVKLYVQISLGYKVPSGL